jgi:poly-D-alanine transfer protein DltD
MDFFLGKKRELWYTYTGKITRIKRSPKKKFLYHDSKEFRDIELIMDRIRFWIDDLKLF